MNDNPLSGPIHRLFDENDRLKKELARVRAERNRLFAHVKDEIRSHRVRGNMSIDARIEAEETCLRLALVRLRGNDLGLSEDDAAALVEHDRQANGEVS